MKYLLLFVATLYSFFCLAQTDTARPEANRETSFENYELLAIAVLGLLLLMGLRFWFKRTRRKQ